MKLFSLFKDLKREFGKGFTFMIVPNSSGAVRSCAIPFSVVVVVLAIIFFNIYVFVGYTAQVWQIKRIQNDIGEKNRQITKLLSEQREVKPTLERSKQIITELNKLKEERDRLWQIWRSVKKKDGKAFLKINRVTNVSSKPYRLDEFEVFIEDDEATDLSILNSNIDQLAAFLKEENNSQGLLIKELAKFEDSLNRRPNHWPLKSSFITSIFGIRRHPILGYYRKHPGIDLRASIGTKVFAAGYGVVIYAGRKGGYGRVVIIDHGNNYKSYYAHLSRYLVRKGQVVRKGQAICLSGNSGTSTGPHLHFEIRRNNRPVNPMKILK